MPPWGERPSGPLQPGRAAPDNNGVSNASPVVPPAAPRSGRLGTVGVPAAALAITALVAVLFALGVMSIGWMIFVAALIAIEKLLPWKAVANHGIAVCLVVLGLAVAFAPAEVPGLVLPDSPAAMRTMKTMEPAPGAAKKMGSGMESGSGDRMPGE